MKSKVFRLLSVFLMTALLITSLSVTAFATGDDPSGDSEISEPEHNDNVRDHPILCVNLQDGV